MTTIVNKSNKKTLVRVNLDKPTKLVTQRMRSR